LATYDTDEEQIEAIKRWWSENGNSLLIGIALVAGGVFGWRQWQESQQASAAEASRMYQQVLSIGAVEPTAVVSEEDMSTAMFVTEELRGEFPNSIYARYAALFLAKLYVDAGDLESAEAELGWILDNPDLGFMQRTDEALLLTARLRLARVLLAQEETQRALDLLAAVEPGPFEGQYADVEGDAWAALGDEVRAREAYERSAASGGNNVLLELKLRDLGSPGA